MLSILTDFSILIINITSKGATMALVKSLENLDPGQIKSILISLLNKITPSEVLAFDQALRSATDQYQIFSEFEGSSAKRDAKLLQRWTHYSWLRLELTYLAKQKAALNKVSALEQAARTSPVPRVVKKTPLQVMPEKIEDFQKLITQPNAGIEALEKPAVVDSVDLAIQEDAAHGVPIEVSINTLSRITLQIVGTEHPTDPLSHVARMAIIKLANVLESQNVTETGILDILTTLQATDAIPASRRNVEEEVIRNIVITLNKLYDALPSLLEAIINAYKTYYGEELYQLYDEKILEAVKNIVRDASWPGFDADGNDNVTPEALRYAIRVYCVQAAEKYMATLQEKIINTSKEIETELRSNIRLLNERILEPSLYFKLVDMPEGKEIVREICLYQTHAAQYLIDRQFYGLISFYEGQREFLQKISNENPFKQVLLGTLTAQHETATKLDQLVRFCGSYRIKKDQIEPSKGAIEEFKSFFENFINNIRANATAEPNKKDEKHSDITNESAINFYHRIIQEHEKVLQQFPVLKLQMRNFGFQLRSFGLTFGFGHIRQDSSVYIRVWETLLEDLKQEDSLNNNQIIGLVRNKRYTGLSVPERTNFHLLLQSGSKESMQILELIYRKYSSNIYLNVEKYKNDKNIHLLCRELDRFDGALAKNMFENVIISNCKSSASIFEVESLLRIFPGFQYNINVVPLLESVDDLENHEAILVDYIKSKIIAVLEKNYLSLSPIKGINNKEEIRSFINSMNPTKFGEWVSSRDNHTIKSLLSKITIEVMLGFSDTERASGLGALITISKTTQKLRVLTQNFGVNFKLFHGPGGDYNRGGLQLRPQIGTLQGIARSVLGTLKSAKRFRETQFYLEYKRQTNRNFVKEFDLLPTHIAESLTECEKNSMQFYEHIQDTEKGLGKLLGLMLGLGSHWMVSILNSSSRATQRGIDEKHGDRTASVQTFGIPPEKYIHPDKPRAITLTQMKEMLREFINLWIGPGYGLRGLGKEKVKRLYDCFPVIRDIFHKMTVAIAMTDLSVTRHALFAGHPELISTDSKQREQWAEECQRNYPKILQSLNIEAMLKTKEGKDDLMIMLSRFFAFLEIEFEKTRNFVLEVNRSIHMDLYRKLKVDKLGKPTDLLLYCSDLKDQIADAVDEVEPINKLFAILVNRVLHGEFIDKIYPTLNGHNAANSKLSGVGSLLANVGAAITSFRCMVPAFYESVYLDYRKNLRPGVLRAEFAAKELRREELYPTRKGIFKFFEDSAVHKINRTVLHRRQKILDSKSEEKKGVLAK